jgi:hypothetical protein
MVYRKRCSAQRGVGMNGASRYFKDTTPKWSNRGKMRRQLIPLLDVSCTEGPSVSVLVQDMYGDGHRLNLNRLANESDQLRRLVYDNVSIPRPMIDCYSR